MEKDPIQKNLKLLIRIILYLFLGMTFMSRFSESLNPELAITILFAIITVSFSFLAYIIKKESLKKKLKVLEEGYSLGHISEGVYRKTKEKIEKHLKR